MCRQTCETISTFTFYHFWAHCLEIYTSLMWIHSINDLRGWDGQPSRTKHMKISHFCILKESWVKAISRPRQMNWVWWLCLCECDCSRHWFNKHHVFHLLYASESNINMRRHDQHAQPAQYYVQRLKHYWWKPPNNRAESKIEERSSKKSIGHLNTY